MIDTIYLEDEMREHPRAAQVVGRFPDAAVIHCDRYTEVFNPAAQSFRLQKARPALIIARKRGNLLFDAPPSLGIGGSHNFYFSHLLNCPYDCRYCFLQGMFRSANYVLFPDFEGFQDAIDEKIAEIGGASNDSVRGRAACFFSGYDCDSLALESITGFADAFVPFFATRPDAVLELRTKSAAIRALLAHPAHDNVVVAFSFTPASIGAALEHRVPDVKSRLEAAAVLASRGWPIGIRLDPLIWHDDWRTGYARLIGALSGAIPPASVHSISLGPLRFPHGMFRRIEKLYPDEPLFAGPLEARNELVSYGAEREAEVEEFISSLLSEWVDPNRVFSFASTAAEPTHAG